MKHLAFATLLAFACPLLAQELSSATATAEGLAKTTVDTAPKLSAAETQAQDYITQHKKIRKIFRQLGLLVRSVRDKESADAAAPKAAKLTDALSAAMEQVEALGDPSAQVEAHILSYLHSNEEESNALAEDSISPMITLLLDEPPCYGSEALNAELSRLLGTLRDAAWSEEEELSGCEGDDEDPSAGEAAAAEEEEADEAEDDDDTGEEVDGDTEEGGAEA